MPAMSSASRMSGVPARPPRLVGADVAGSRGAGVVLRPFADADVPCVIAAGADPYIPLVTTVPAGVDAEAARAYVRRQHARTRQGRGYSFAVADAATDEALGQIGLWTADLLAGRASTGYWISPEARGRGHARAALATLTAWALTVPGVARLHLFVEPWNEASWRAAAACGYEREGLLRSWQRVGDARRDVYVYSILAAGAGS